MVTSPQEQVAVKLQFPSKVLLHPLYSYMHATEWCEVAQVYLGMNYSIDRENHLLDIDVIFLALLGKEVDCAAV